MYKTSDLYLASYLKAKGYELLDVEDISGKKTFVFAEEPEKIKQIVVDYFDGKGEVEPRVLIDHIKNMKALTHNT